MKKPRTSTSLAAIDENQDAQPRTPATPAFVVPAPAANSSAPIVLHNPPISPTPKALALVAPKLPTDPPPNLNEEDRQRLASMKQQGDLLRDFSCGLCLSKMLEGLFGGKVQPQGYQYYRDELLREAGNPADPIERMLIEQLALAYHSIARLHLKAAAAQTPDEAETYSSAAARLLDEFRRTALAYRDFRIPLTPKKVTLINQQNLANGDQQVAYVSGGLPENSSCSEISHNPEEYENE